MPKKKKTTRSEEENVSSTSGGAKASAKRPRKAAPKKAGAPRAAAAKKKGKTAPSHEEISLRAYLLAEKRHQHGLPGDANTDWLEARRQLYAEANVPLEK